MSGQVLHFNARDAKVDVPYSADLNPQSFTVEIWAKVIGDPGHWRSPITCRDDHPQRGFIIYGGEDNRWQFWIGHGSGWSGIDGPDIAIGPWTHLAGTYDWSSKNMLFYINGQRVGAKTSSLALNTARPLRIGAGGTEGSGEYWFDGQLCEARLWNHVRSGAQIQEEMGLRMRGDEHGLVGYWPLSKGAGTSVIDHTSARHDGAIFNCTWAESSDLPVSEPRPSTAPENSDSKSADHDGEQAHADGAGGDSGGSADGPSSSGGSGDPVGTGGSGDEQGDMRNHMLSFEQFTRAIQSAVTDAAQAVMYKNLEVIDSMFVEVDGELPSPLAALTSGDAGGAADRTATDAVTDVAAAAAAAAAAGGSSTGQPSKYLQPRMVLMKFPHVGPDGPTSHLVHVPLISLVPLAQVQMEELRFKTDLELGVSGGQVTVGFPKSKSSSGKEGASESGAPTASLEIVLTRADLPSGYKHVLDGYDKTLRAQIPG